MKRETTRSIKNYTGKIKVSVIQDECSFNFNTELQNIQSAANNLKLKDVLKIEVKGMALAVLNRKNEICGHLVSPHNGNIIACIKEKGKKYNAIVYAIDSNSYKITVKVVQ
jgi:hypothetical protein